MVVRLKINYGSPLRRVDSFNRRVALGTAALLGPVSVMAFVLGGWRLGADLNITGEFAISSGLFSHWQVWLALGAALQAAATVLYRFATRNYADNDAAAL